MFGAGWKGGLVRPVEPEGNLETRRMVLEPIRVSHAGLVYEYLFDERLYRFIPQTPPESLQALEDRYEFLSSRVSPDGREVWLNWAMRERGSDDSYVGLMEATVCEEGAAAVAYIVYMIFVPFQRRGFASEGCERIVRHLFEEYEVEVVAAEIGTRNAASVSLVESLGFERVATTMGADFFKGASSDEHRCELRMAARG